MKCLKVHRPLDNDLRSLALWNEKNYRILSTIPFFSHEYSKRKKASSLSVGQLWSKIIEIRSRYRLEQQCFSLNKEAALYTRKHSSIWYIWDTISLQQLSLFSHAAPYNIIFQINSLLDLFSSRAPSKSNDLLTFNTNPSPVFSCFERSVRL